mgnify:CR=1 FL=1
MFVALVVPQNIFLMQNQLSKNILVNIFEEFSENPQKKGNDQLEIIYNFVKKYMKM